MKATITIEYNSYADLKKAIDDLCNTVESFEDTITDTGLTYNTKARPAWSYKSDFDKAGDKEDVKETEDLGPDYPERLLGHRQP